MLEVSSAIVEIRRRYGFEPGDQLKFNTRCRPTQVGIGDYTLAKNAVIEACSSAGVKFIACLILHKIATRELVGEFTLNTLLAVFNGKFLKEKNDYGMVLIDRLPDNSQAYDMLKRKFQDGLPIESTGSEIKLDRIILYAATCDGASHLSSAVDIVLGGLRWVVNSQGRPTLGGTERRILTNVAGMMYGKKHGDTLNVRDYGLILRPVVIWVPAYQAEYDSLVEYMINLAQD
jgi:hypothetical protein